MTPHEWVDLVLGDRCETDVGETVDPRAGRAELRARLWTMIEDELSPSQFRVMRAVDAQGGAPISGRVAILAGASIGLQPSTVITTHGYAKHRLARRLFVPYGCAGAVEVGWTTEEVRHVPPTAEEIRRAVAEFDVAAMKRAGVRVAGDE